MEELNNERAITSPSKSVIVTHISLLFDIFNNRLAFDP